MDQSTLTFSDLPAHSKEDILMIAKPLPMLFEKTQTRNVFLLLIRIWLGYRMIGASYSSVIDIIFHPGQRAFFIKWFGDELHFPMPLTMAFLAKGSELLGGILVIPGLLTRPASLLIAFTMFVATVTANLGENWIIDGGFTVSYILFALLLMMDGAGKYSLDYVLFRKKKLIPSSGIF